MRPPKYLQVTSWNGMHRSSYKLKITMLAREYCCRCLKLQSWQHIHQSYANVVDRWRKTLLIPEISKNKPGVPDDVCSTAATIAVKTSASLRKPLEHIPNLRFLLAPTESAILLGEILSKQSMASTDILGNDPKILPTSIANVYSCRCYFRDIS
jgi:hypothetical protein